MKMTSYCPPVADYLQRCDHMYSDPEVSNVFNGSVNWLQAHRLRSNIPEELRVYVRSEFGEEKAEWFLVKHENDKVYNVIDKNAAVETHVVTASA